MDHSDIVGAWRLLSAEIRQPDGSTSHPFGRQPVGMFMLDAEGNVSAHVLAEDRPELASPVSDSTEEELRAAFGRAVGYFGRCRFDPAESTITTDVVGSLNPAWQGGQQVRHVSWDEGRLLLRPPTRESDGVPVDMVFTWERIA